MMLKKMLFTLVLSSWLPSCGSNPSLSEVGNEGCIYQCAMLFSKSDNKCRLDYAGDTDKQLECSTGIMVENDKCQGKCLGNL